MNYHTRRKRAASERGRRMANRRWELDRQRRDELERQALDARLTAPKILRRVVVIEGKQIVKEAVILDSDSYREAKRKLRRIGL